MEKTKEEVLEPVVARVGGIDQNLATLGEQVLMVREEGVATREVLQELRQRCQDILEVQEETERVVRYASQEAYIHVMSQYKEY